MNKKKVFIFVIGALVVLLIAMPFTLSINDVLTKGVENMGWFIWIQEKIVPWGVRFVGVVVKPLGITFIAYKDGFTVNGIPALFSWNCLGWQSLVLFLISLPFGFKGAKFTFLSKLKAITIGILGIFLFNLLRIVFTIILLVISKPLFAIFFHDYLVAIITIVWLFFFWWFSYAYVLEEKSGNLKK